MGMLLAFLPFLVFALLERIAGPAAGLLAGTAVSGGLLLRDRLTPGRSPKLLEIGTLLLFGALSVIMLAGAAWSVVQVRLAVDAGLLLIVLATLAIGRPFTLQYAREQVPEAYWNSPEFHRTNVVITAAWAVAFAVLVAVEGAMVALPGFPHQLGVVVIVLALVGAVKFTQWYPSRSRGR